MDNNRIQYFITICKTGSAANAAKLLRISPAALSKAMGILEKEVGFKLFTEHGRTLKVTPDGMLFARKAEPLLQSLMELPAQLSSQKNETIKFGSFEVFSTYFLASFIKRFENQDASWEVHEYLPGEIENALVQNKIDFALSYLPVPHLDVEHREVTTIEMAVFGKRTFLKTPFEELPFTIPLSRVEGAINRATGLDGWPDDKFKRKIHSKVVLMQTAIELVKAGAAIAYLPQFIARLAFNSDIVEIPSPKFKTQKQSVYLVMRSGENETTFTKKMTSFLRSLQRT